MTWSALPPSDAKSRNPITGPRTMSNQRSSEPAPQATSSAEEAEIERSWRAEVRRRMEHILAGDVEWIDEDDVLAELEGDAYHDPAWVTEMERRLREIDSGTAETRPAEEIFSRLRARRGIPPATSKSEPASG